MTRLLRCVRRYAADVLRRAGRAASIVVLFAIAATAPAACASSMSRVAGTMASGAPRFAVEAGRVASVSAGAPVTAADQPAGPEALAGSGIQNSAAYSHEAKFPDAMLTRDPEVITLRSGVRTRLLYSIKLPVSGPNSADPHSRSPESRSMSPEAAAELEAGDRLEVAFQCSFCSLEDNLQPEGTITLDRRAGETNQIEFNFTPEFNQIFAAALPSGAGTDQRFITLVLFSRGVRHDQVEIPVDLISDREAVNRINEYQSALRLAGEAPERAALWRVLSLTVLSLPIVQPSDSYPDVKLVLKMPSNGEQTLRVEAVVFRPDDAGAAAALHQELKAKGFTLGPEDLSIEFDTGLTTNFFENQLLAIYEALSCLTIPQGDGSSEADNFRAELNARHGARCDGPVGTREQWSSGNEDANRAASRLYREGAALFMTLFGSPQGSELARLMIALRTISEERLSRQPSGSPLKIRYHFGDYHVPLQLAHPLVAPFDRMAPQFFGLSFDIVAGVGAAGRGAPNLTTTMDQRPRWAISFAGYRKSPQSSFNAQSNCDLMADAVEKQSCQHFQMLQKALQAANRLENSPAPFFESASFVQDLVTRARSLDLIWTFAHGKTRFDEATHRATARAGAPRILMMPPSDASPPLSPERIDGITPIMLERSPLRDNPLVVLIACETGTAGSGGTSGQSFVQSFIHAGARGVITTESEVGSITANLFGQKLLARLISGAAPSAAVLQARRDVFGATNGNLWPLLFHYAGAHGRFREN